MTMRIHPGKFGAGMAALVLSLALAGCGSGISYEEARALRSELRDVESRLDRLDGELAALADRVDSGGREEIAGLRDQIGRASESLASVSESLKPPERPERTVGETPAGTVPGMGGDAYDPRRQ